MGGADERVNSLERAFPQGISSLLLPRRKKLREYAGRRRGGGGSDVVNFPHSCCLWTALLPRRAPYARLCCVRVSRQCACLAAGGTAPPQTGTGEKLRSGVQHPDQLLAVLGEPDDVCVVEEA